MTKEEFAKRFKVGDIITCQKWKEDNLIPEEITKIDVDRVYTKELSDRTEKIKDLDLNLNNYWFNDVSGEFEFEKVEQ